MTDKLFMDVKDVTKILEVSDGKAYEIMNVKRRVKAARIYGGSGKSKYKVFFQKTNVSGLRRIYGSI